MSVEIMLPCIGSGSSAEQLEQMKRYLYQLARQLQWALSSLEEGRSGVRAGKMASASEDKETFESVKSLIINSTDIVNAYYGSISRRLEGRYLARGEFGEYAESTALTLEANAKEIAQLYERLESVDVTTEGMTDTLTSVTAHIRSGYLGEEDGAPVYGVEIGQRTEVDGEEVFNKFARFSAGRLTFYDDSGVEQAYISDKKLFVSALELPAGEMGAYRLSDLRLTCRVGDVEAEILCKRWSDGRLEGSFSADLLEAGISRLSTSGYTVSVTLPEELSGARAFVTLDSNVAAAACVNADSGLTLRVFSTAYSSSPTRLTANIYLIKEV